jgi:hypothetical protein
VFTSVGMVAAPLVGRKEGWNRGISSPLTCAFIPVRHVETGRVYHFIPGEEAPSQEARVHSIVPVGSGGPERRCVGQHLRVDPDSTTLSP